MTGYFEIRHTDCDTVLVAAGGEYPAVSHQAVGNAVDACLGRSCAKCGQKIATRRALYAQGYRGSSSFYLEFDQDEEDGEPGSGREFTGSAYAGNAASGRAGPPG